jgi:hypothetical protein
VGKVYIKAIAAEIDQPNLSDLIRQFIYNQKHPDDISSASISHLPIICSKITIYSSAVVTYRARAGDMRRERIHAVKSWRNGPGRYDTIWVNTGLSADGIRGFDPARVQLFFSYSHFGDKYPCALVHWFSRVGDSPDEHTGKWVYQQDDDERPPSIIHLDSIVRPARLV